MVDKSRVQDSFSGRIIIKISMFHQSMENWSTRFVQRASWEVSRAVKDALRMLRIIVFLHSAEDLQSVLRLYGVRDSKACQSPNEM